MYEAERERAILRVVAEQDFVSVQDLTQRLDISEATIRRDLKQFLVNAGQKLGTANLKYFGKEKNAWQIEVPDSPNTCAPTLGRSRTSAPSAPTGAVGRALSPSTCAPTLGRSRTSAPSAPTQQSFGASGKHILLR